MPSRQSLRAQASIESNCGPTAVRLHARASIEASRCLPAGCRAQASIELLAYVAFFLVVFIAGASTFIFLQSQETSRAENAYAQQVAYSFADSIQAAFIAGPGFSQSVAIPETMLGKPYVIAISHSNSPIVSQSGLVYVWWESQNKRNSFSAPTVTTNYSAQSCCILPPINYIWQEGDLILINSSVGSVNMYNLGGRIHFTRVSP